MSSSTRSYCTDISYCNRSYCTDALTELVLNALILTTKFAPTALILLTELVPTAPKFLSQLVLTALIFLTELVRTAEGHIKLIDFGLSKQMHDPGGHTHDDGGKPYYTCVLFVMPSFILPFFP